MIEQATRQLVEVAHPDKVILFGSHARHDATRRSDLDLLVIVPMAEHRIEESVRLRLALRNLPIAVDLIVYTRADVEQRGNLPGTMLYHALREGKVLYDAA